MSLGLLLGAVLGVVVLLELLALALWAPGASRPSGDSARLRLLLHAGAIVAVLVGSGVVLRRGRTAAAEARDEVHRREILLQGTVAGLEERVQELASRLARSDAEQEDALRVWAYELHNGLGPMVVSAQQHLATFQDLWTQGSPASEGELRKGLERLDRAVVETRLLLASLRPAALGSLGFLPAIRTLVEERSRAGGWKADLTIDVGDVGDSGARGDAADRGDSRGSPVPGTIETAVYRIVEEALTNVTRHSHASSVSVTLLNRGGTLRLDVADSGVGLGEGLRESARRGFGLTGMRERARLVGGRCQIQSEPAGGTRVSVTIPLGAPPGTPGTPGMPGTPRMTDE